MIIDWPSRNVRAKEAKIIMPAATKPASRTAATAITGTAASGTVNSSVSPLCARIGASTGFIVRTMAVRLSAPAMNPNVAT